MSARGRAALLVVLAVLTLVASALRMSAAHPRPRYDEVVYLALARDYAREGGVVGTVRCHLEGRCREDNRPPLFHLLVQPFADDTPAAFARAKLVTLATALFLVLAVFLVVRRTFSGAVAVGSAVALCLMPELQDLGSRLLHDPLYAALTFLTVAAIAAWQERGAGWWVAAGALIGLAFLTKGSGHLLFFALVATSLYHHRARLVRRPIVYAAVAGFLAVSWFLLWRNVELWGSPFYNINGVLLWIDRWRDVWGLMRSPEWKHVGLGWYLQRHSPLDLVLVVVKGVGITAGTFAYVAGIGLPYPVARAVTGAVVLALAAFGVRRRWRAGRRVEVVAALSAVAIYFAALSLAQGGGLGANLRYSLPYVALLLPYAVHQALERFWPPLRAWLSACAPRVDPATLALSLLAAFMIGRLALAAPAAAADPRGFYAVEPQAHETSLWLSRTLAPGEKFAIDFRDYYSTWDVPRPDTDPRWSFWLGMPASDLRQAMQANGIGKVLVDMAGAEHTEYADKLSDRRDAHGPLSFLGWPRCFADSGAPSRLLVYCRP